MPSFKPIFRRERLLVLAEIGLVFIVFLLHGAWPAPDSNEAHYLGKAIHYWNPAWCENDFFLNTDNTHFVFYVGFGWLSLLLGPVALAWTGRVATWWLLAWAWRRLNWAVLGRRWWSIATAAVTLLLISRFAMAGEWFIGGVEAKGFAYVLVLLGIEAIVRDRWNLAWLAFGGASLVHVLVGGWAAIAAGLAWLLAGRGNRPTLLAMWPALVGGLALALPSLIESLQISWGVDPQIVDQANRIYVFERLEHHLFPADFPVLRFAILLFVWLAVRWQTPEKHAVWRLHGFVAGAVLISLAGFVITYATAGHPGLAASLLRFYWFRLTDVMVPAGVAIGAAALIGTVPRGGPLVARAVKIALILLATWQISANVQELIAGRTLRGTYGSERSHAADWRDACRWIATSERIPKAAVFLTPQHSRTFRWLAGRAEVVNWKDVPQDPKSIVEWWRRQRRLHATGNEKPNRRWFDSLAEQGEDRLVELGQHYRADYVLTTREPPLALPIEYQNDSFVIYRLPTNPDDQ